MNSDLSNEDSVIWRNLVQAHYAWTNAWFSFTNENVDRVALVRYALRTGELATAFTAARYMREAEILELFPEWLDWAIHSQNYFDSAFEIIMQLPHEWVLQHIEATAEPLLKGANHDEYSALLSLYSHLDYGLAMQLAQRMETHPDPEVQERGSEFLEELHTETT